MAKTPTTTEPRPKAVDVLVNVSELALTYKFPDRVATISEMSRTVSTAYRLLRFSNLDEKIETENQVVLTLAKKRQLIS
jgi:hypothetical protein